MLIEPCPSCQHPCEVAIGQHAQKAPPRLWWSASYHCGHCGERLELDDTGVAPAPYRQALLAAGGIWLLTGIAPADALAALRIVRPLFRLPIASLGQVRQHLIDAVGYGTAAEAHFLQNLLAAANVPSTVRRIQATAVIGLDFVTMQTG